MVEAAQKVPAEAKRFRVKPTGADLRSLQTPELVIALCGPIGSPLHEVSSALKALLERQHGYSCEVLRLSEFIDEASGHRPDDRERPFERIKRLIESGNRLRETYGASVLADLAIRRIALSREEAEEKAKKKNADEKEKTPDYRPRRVCHIIDSVKNKEELQTLRLVYQDLLFTIGVFASLEAREARMKAMPMNMSELYSLIDRDSGEEVDFGQTVRDIFPKADFFLRADGDSTAHLEGQLARLLGLVFNLRVITPTLGETAMYQATAAARNSACMSRQVGAAIVDDKSGRLISVGWNDVPCFGGGLYRCDAASKEADRRCYNWHSQCEAESKRRELAGKTVDSIIDKYRGEGASRDELIETVLKSSIGSLIEFTRAVHAEMHAILSARTSLENATLYCTAYPCHYCAPHIIAAGIREVRYIEPYRKSLAIDLHGDAMCEKESDDGKVRVLPYEGVSPARYLELFGTHDGSRKDKQGKAVERSPVDAHPKTEFTLQSVPVLEGLVLQKLQERKVPNVGQDPEERHA